MLILYMYMVNSAKQYIQHNNINMVLLHEIRGHFGLKHQPACPSDSLLGIFFVWTYFS